MSTIEQALQQAEQMAIATAAEEQEYQYSTQYLRRTQYVSDNAPIEVVNKEIQSMNDETSVKGEAISQYIEFRLDRYQDGIDLLGMLFNIHYEKSIYGGEDRPINVRYNDTKIILGWAIPNAAVKEAGVLNMCIWATGRLYDDTYVWKTKPKSYTVNDGLTIAENIIEPDENWYIQFVNELEAKIQEFSGRIDDIVQVEESLSTDIQVINEKYDSIMASAETAGQSAASAQTSEQNAQLYKEQTQQIAEQVKDETSKVYKYKGSVPTYDSLPTENVSNGDVYNVESDGMNYAWDEANQKWDSLGIIIDLSKYSTTEQIELMLNQYVQKESGKGLFSGSYDDLSNKPKIEGTELSGNKTLDELNIASKTAFESLSENVSTNADGITNLNNNLSQLEFGENSGSKNLFEPSTLLNANYDENTDTITVLTNTNKALDMVFKENTQYTFSAYIKQSSIDTNIRFHIIYTDGTSDENFLLSQSTSEVYISATSKSGKTISEVEWIWGSGGTATFRHLQIEEGTQATPYEPYIPSVKMLADEVSAQNESLSVIGKCKNLLNPTLQTTTKNGVTCTNNGDGTYTLNGTNNTDSLIWFELTDFFTLEPNKKYKLVGGYPNSNRPFIDSEALWFLELYNSNQSLLYTRDYGDGRVFATTETTLAAEIGVRKGATFNNFTFKPMLTECLDATYDDFVPYTGDGDTLSADVAELKSDLGGLSFSVSGTTLSITDGTNTWTLSK